jgi:hypothetical protein
MSVLHKLITPDVQLSVLFLSMKLLVNDYARIEKRWNIFENELKWIFLAWLLKSKAETSISKMYLFYWILTKLKSVKTGLSTHCNLLSIDHNQLEKVITPQKSWW